jgi:hypothetical protein
MPRASGQKDYMSMAKGLVTEASSLAFPEGATSNELNFTIDRNGLIRKRRLGFDKLVADFVIAGVDVKLENVFYWRGPSLVGVIITDNTPQTILRFHAVDDNFTFIAQIVIATSVVTTQVAQTTTLLTLTTSSGTNPVLCEYDSVAEEINVGTVGLHIRDFELVDDGLGVSERIATIDNNHRYNLYNSTWYQEKADFNDASTRKNVSVAYFDTTAEYPSNADVASVGIIDDGSGNIVFDADYVKDAEFGSGLSARGHFVYNILNIDRTTRLSTPAVSGAPSTTITNLGTINLTGVPTYNPDDPDDGAGGGPSGGGGVPPYEEDGNTPIGGEIP